MNIVLNNLLKVAVKIAKFLNRYLLSPKSGCSSLAASGSLSEPLSHWVPVPAGQGPQAGAAPWPAGAAEVTDTIRVPDATAAVWAAAVVLPGPPFAAAARAPGPPAAGCPFSATPAASQRPPLLRRARHWDGCAAGPARLCGGPCPDSARKGQIFTHLACCSCDVTLTTILNSVIRVIGSEIQVTKMNI